MPRAPATGRIHHGNEDVRLHRSDQRDDSPRGAALKRHHRQADQSRLKLLDRAGRQWPGRRIARARDRRWPPGDGHRRCRRARRARRSACGSRSSACARNCRASRAAGSASLQFRVPGSGFGVLWWLFRRLCDAPRLCRHAPCEHRTEPEPEPNENSRTRNPEPGTWNCAAIGLPGRTDSEPLGHARAFGSASRTVPGAFRVP